MIKYEYQTKIVDRRGDELNIYGQDGWLAVNIINIDRCENASVVMARLIEEQLEIQPPKTDHEMCHQERHEELHSSLDELLADYIRHHDHSAMDIPVNELIQWSHEQTLNPTSTPN